MKLIINPTWQSLSNKYQAGMMKDIIGFEITITRVEKVNINSVKIKVRPIEKIYRQPCSKVQIHWFGLLACRDETAD